MGIPLPPKFNIDKGQGSPEINPSLTKQRCLNVEIGEGGLRYTGMANHMPNMQKALQFHCAFTVPFGGSSPSKKACLFSGPSL